MTTNLRDLALRPRAIATLCTLRRGPRSTGDIADALGDADINETRSLLLLMSEGIDGARTGRKLVQAAGPRSWGLTHDGLGWLQSQGLDATEDAKQAMYGATPAPAPVPVGNFSCDICHSKLPGPAGAECPLEHFPVGHAVADSATDAQAVR